MPDIREVIISMIAKSFATIFTSIREPGMQRAVMAERLNDMDSDTISELLNFIVSRSEQDDLKFKPIISIFRDIPYLIKVLGNEKLSEIYQLLDIKGYHNVRELMVPHPVRRRGKSDDELLSSPEMDKLPLGTKKTLAKSSDKHILDKLIYEEHPIIIRNLLNNSRTTVNDVLKIITRRPIKKSILQEVIKSKRWIDRYIIKKAIIRNPYSPTNIALNLLHSMLFSDLGVIAKDAGLHYSIRAAAEKLIKKKREHEPKE